MGSASSPAIVGFQLFLWISGQQPVLTLQRLPFGKRTCKQIDDALGIVGIDGAEKDAAGRDAIGALPGGTGIAVVTHFSKLLEKATFGISAGLQILHAINFIRGGNELAGQFQHL